MKWKCLLLLFFLLQGVLGHKVAANLEAFQWSEIRWLLRQVAKHYTTGNGYVHDYRVLWLGHRQPRGRSKIGQDIPFGGEWLTYSGEVMSGIQSFSRMCPIWRIIQNLRTPTPKTPLTKFTSLHPFIQAWRCWLHTRCHETGQVICVVYRYLAIIT